MAFPSGKQFGTQLVLGGLTVSGSDLYLSRSTSTTVTARFSNQGGISDCAFDGTSFFFTNYAAGDINFNPTAASASSVFFAGGSERLRVNSAAVKASVPVLLPSFTVAGLPAAGTVGRMAFCSNCRVFNGLGVMEAAGSGTGGLVVDNGAAWKVAGTNVTASA